MGERGYVVDMQRDTTTTNAAGVVVHKLPILILISFGHNQYLHKLHNLRSSQV